jgi:putative proteasome-type protease
MSQVLTQRSNLTVGPPFELAVIPRGSLSIERRLRLEADDPMLAEMIDIWSNAQREALYRLPALAWQKP